MNTERIKVETGVGILVIAGLLSLGYLSIRLGDVQVFGKNNYSVMARFTSVTGLKEGADIEIAGVRVGRVAKIRLSDYEAEVEMLIDPQVKIQDDSIAAIRTQGIIGDKYVKIIPGGSDELVTAGGEMYETEPAIEIEELISKYIFEKE